MIFLSIHEGGKFIHAPTAVQQAEKVQNHWFRRIFHLFDLCVQDMRLVV
jgi:hypothetical protein